MTPRPTPWTLHGPIGIGDQHELRDAEGRLVCIVPDHEGDAATVGEWIILAANAEATRDARIDSCEMSPAPVPVRVAVEIARQRYPSR